MLPADVFVVVVVVVATSNRPRFSCFRAASDSLVVFAVVVADADAAAVVVVAYDGAACREPFPFVSSGTFSFCGWTHPRETSNTNASGMVARHFCCCCATC